MIGKLDLEAIEERLRRITQERWYRQEYYTDPTADHLASYEQMLRAGAMDGPDRDWPAVDYVQAIIPTSDRLDIEAVTVCIVGNGPTSRFNAQFIEHAPEDIRVLLAEVERLWSIITEAHSVVGDAPLCRETAEAQRILWRALGDK